ncbi:MAG: VOC family protein [Planctomycetota bacterium]
MARNPVGWFEIYVEDLDRAQRFYESVLGVSLTPLPTPPQAEGMPALTMLAFPMDEAASGAAGALVRMEGVASGGNSVMVYFNCDDCETEAGRVVAAGGRLQQGKMPIGDYGFIALAFDTEGNMFGLHSTR